MENIFGPIEIDDLDKVTGGQKIPTPKGGDGASIARWDKPTFPRLPDALKGKTKGKG
jgi:hypothetical protein